jgi:hypothetical protein
LHADAAPAFTEIEPDPLRCGASAQDNKPDPPAAMAPMLIAGPILSGVNRADSADSTIHPPNFPIGQNHCL